MTQFTYTDRDGQELVIEPEETWTNYGDMNPRIHGGRWVRWEGDMWHIITTTHPHDLPTDFTETEHLIEHTWVEPEDVFEGGNPDEGPTDTLASIIDSLHRCSGYVNALVDFSIEYFVADYTFWIHSSRDDMVDDTEYWNYLEQFEVPTDRGD